MSADCMATLSGTLRTLRIPQPPHPRPTRPLTTFLRLPQRRLVTIDLLGDRWSRNRSLLRSRPSLPPQPITRRSVVRSARLRVSLPDLVAIAIEPQREEGTEVLNRAGAVPATSVIGSPLVLGSGTGIGMTGTEVEIAGREDLRWTRTMLRGIRIGLLSGRDGHVNPPDRGRGRGRIVLNCMGLPSAGAWLVEAEQFRGTGQAYLLVVRGRWRRLSRVRRSNSTTKPGQTSGRIKVPGTAWSRPEHLPLLIERRPLFLPRRDRRLPDVMMLGASMGSRRRRQAVV
jgi:hypothetical protein